MTTTYGPVTQDGVEVFQAHYDPEKRWNGSLVPSFDRAEAEKVAAHLMAPPDDDITRMEWDGDVLIYTQHHDPSIAPIRIEPDENNLYDIGNHCGHWSVPEADECETDEDQQERATPTAVEPTMTVYYANDLTDSARYCELVLAAPDETTARGLAQLLEDDDLKPWTDRALSQFTELGKDYTGRLRADVILSRPADA
ncbi:hypothetical protein GCM10009789_83360 [Kribbella sancticallisti]|uniref:Uncharacterized protein n=1 Tax=Kribbella sancticallisti TaxID=460087 RepID=A0ABP4QTV9_9ACTN